MKNLLRALILALALTVSPMVSSPAEAACRPTNGQVIMFGDSMTVGAKSTLQAIRPKWRIDAKWGRGVSQLPVRMDLWLRSHPGRPRLVIIALGTNEEAGWTRAHYVRSMNKFPIGTRFVFVNTYRPGAAAAGLSDGRVYSQWMRDIDLARPGVTIANWRKFAMADPRLIRDGTHQSSAGIKVWVKQVTDAAYYARKGC